MNEWSCGIKANTLLINQTIFGLKFLHGRCIVYVELKANNILILKIKHVLISDFDRSNDLSVSYIPPCPWDFFVNPVFAAPQIVNGSVIFEESDI